MKTINPLLTDDDREWKPRNKQAALIVRPAGWINRPLSVPLYVPSPEEIAKAEAETLAKNAARMKAENDKFDAERKKIQQEQKERASKRPKTSRCIWARDQLRAIHKRKGLPKPTVAEVWAYRKTLPNYGKPI